MYFPGGRVTGVSPEEGIRGRNVQLCLYSVSKEKTPVLRITTDERGWRLARRTIVWWGMHTDKQKLVAAWCLLFWIVVQ